MRGTQAQFESEADWFDFEEHMSSVDLKEYEEWVDSLYWEARAEEVEKGEDF